MQPDGELFYVHDPEDDFAQADLLRQAAASDARRLFVAITPGADNARGVGGDILAALGKDQDTPGSGRSARDTWLRAQIWLQVSEVREMLISRAHLLPTALLEQVLHAALLGGTRLVLIFQTAALRRGQQRFLANWPLRKLSIGQLAESVDIKRVPVRKAATNARLPVVPIDDFTTFRAAARQLLTAADFALVDKEFRSAFVATSGYLDGRERCTEAAICQHVRDLIGDSDWMPQIVTRVRGSQVAAFKAGWLMKVNLHVLANTRAPRVYLDERTLSILEQLDTPRLAAGAALTVATGLPLETLLALNLDDVGGDGARIRLGKDLHELPPRAARLVEVLVRERLAHLANDDDPLFIYSKASVRQQGTVSRWTKRGMLDALKQVERETGLMLAAHLSDAGQPNAVAWAHRRGISLQRIVNG